MTAAKAKSGGFLAHWRFNLFLVLVILGAPALTPALGWSKALIVAFDVAAIVFIATALWLMRGGTPDSMRQQAARVDADRFELLAITILMLGVVLTALVVELGAGKSNPFGAGLAVATLAIAWLFTSTVYALHYAHLYYGDGNAEGGLDFPGAEDPDYWDFLYFAIVLGSTFQVSDVEITKRGMRRVAMVHGLVAFFFNIGVVALTINVVGSAL